MSARSFLTIAALATSVALSSPALALNPQPEPPMPYHGYEYVLTHVDPFDWRWEVRHTLPNGQTVTVKSGTIRGNRMQAGTQARTAIDDLATPATTTGAGPVTAPPRSITHAPVTFFKLTCHASLFPPLSVDLTNEGPAVAPAGTKISWWIDMGWAGPGTGGSYTFTSGLPSGSKLTLQNVLPKTNLNYGAGSCHVTVK